MIFAVFVGVINLAVPSHFEKEARNALEYEMKYIDKVKESDGDNESMEDEEYYGTFLSGNIRFIDFYDEGYSVSDSLEKDRGKFVRAERRGRNKKEVQHQRPEKR